jgi:hypothetical protein
MDLKTGQRQKYADLTMVNGTAEVYIPASYYPKSSLFFMPVMQSGEKYNPLHPAECICNFTQSIHHDECL